MILSLHRTRSIRWKWVCFNFLQVVGVLFYLYFIFVRFCVPVLFQFEIPALILILFFNCQSNNFRFFDR
jgi:sterol O-acyltransferase